MLALRGDYIDGEQLVGEFNHASDLVSYIPLREAGLQRCLVLTRKATIRLTRWTRTSKTSKSRLMPASLT